MSDGEQADHFSNYFPHIRRAHNPDALERFKEMKEIHDKELVKIAESLGKKTARACYVPIMFLSISRGCLLKSII